ncbi:MAG: hypothetical protein BYD32DRAFT_164142 [Podila humilis]|nr:MAG: hypothetical protein BYD32DRAFT_164142 [Podila humilis]
MQVRFRRTSNSVAYACIWWATFLFSRKCRTDLLRLHQSQQHSFGRFLLADHRTATLPFPQRLPDILMCSTSTKISLISSFNDVAAKNMTINDINVTNAILPIYHDLCNTHNWLTIFSTQERLVNVTQNENGIFWLELTPQTATLWIAWLFFVPNYNIPFRIGYDVPHNVWYDYFDNQILITQDNTLMTVQAVNVETYALRSDIWGYFGSLYKVPQRSVQTENTSAYYSGQSRIQIFFPKEEIVQRQIL